tara:strand:+ start:131 stop:1504 length:1374 start_codon:yes stop_codon:yes gene_type:complete
MSVIIQESNRKNFEIMSEGQLSRLLDGSTTEVRVTAQLQAEARAWILERNLAGESNALGFEVTGNITGNTANDAFTERIIATNDEKESIIKQDKDPDPLEALSIGPLKGMRPSKNSGLTYRYPSDAIDSQTDYVFFQFGKYEAPFGRDVKELAKIKRGEKGDGKYNKNDAAEAGKARFAKAHTSSINAYNDSVNVLKPKGSSIMLPIPQDVGHEVAQQWQGKQWSATGRAATAALGAGQLSDASAMLSDVAGWGTAVQTSLTQMALNVLPGVGGNISFNDLSGATRGIVINPNAELMYDSPEMREIGMVFKMVPRTPEESKIIRRICQAFRLHSMPTYGGADNQDAMDQKIDGLFDDIKNTTRGSGGDSTQLKFGAMNNFIRVPDLCKFTFMHGNKVHPYLVQFKPCAISKVEVTYTPDGTFSTYSDGAPTAVELRLSLMETKVVFSDEVNLDGASF